MKTFLIILFSSISNILFAQVFTLSGKIVDAKLQPISYATVSIKEKDLNTTTDAKGNYQFNLYNGKFDIVVSMNGYEQQTATIIIDKQNTMQNIILLQSKNIITNIKVTSSRKDRSEEIVKNTIAAKEQLQKNSGSYNCKMYIKAVQENESKKTERHIFGRTIVDSAEFKKDSITKFKNSLSEMAMAEVVINLDFQYPNKIKETREGVKKNGDISTLFYLSKTDGDFNFYKNLVTIPALSEMSFLSPISYSGLIAYKYKTINIYTKDGIKYYHIKVSPTKTANALVEGDMTIMDSTWALVNFKFSFPKYHTPEYSFFQVEQNYKEVSEKNWLPEKQIFTYKANKTGKANGVTTVNYLNYNTDTIFDKKHFGNELSSTTQEAYERDSTFWNTQRIEPLTNKELQFLHFKDSVYQITHSTKYLDSVDKKTNEITFKKVLLEGVINYKRAAERRITINPLIATINFFSLGGFRYGTGLQYSKKQKNKKEYGGYAYGNYGPLNNDLMGTINLYRVYNAFNHGRFFAQIGSNFDFLFVGDAIINTLSRSNYFKKNNIKVGHFIELKNGLYLFTDLEIAKRFSLANYKLSNKALDTLHINGSNLNKPLDFPTYNALYSEVKLTYTPNQLYIREPYQKIILGSKWPTFYAKWRKGYNGILGSTINYDYIELGLNKKINAGTLGIGYLSGYYGNFINKTNLQAVDYKWVRRGDPFFFYNPEYNFQALDSTFAIFKGFAEAHYYHQFNGAIINKIPLVKKLNIVESAGSSILYCKEKNLIYGEVYVGFEKQIKLFGELFRLGGFCVSSYANKYNNPLQWKFGIRHYDIYNNKWE